ncbi:MAG: hypothetical protein II956_16435 [Bacteroidales bacterium]|nr:hypothetical protein [Bacteroidales bacterium]
MKTTVMLLAFVLFAGFAYGQRGMAKHVVYGGVGGNMFFGDLGGSENAGHAFSDFDVNSLRPSFTLGYEYRFYRNLSVRLGTVISRVAGDDANSKNEARKARNLNFRSNIVTFGFNIDYYLVPEGSYHSNMTAGDRFSMYFTTGFSAFKFNPQGSLDGQWYDLQPLCTEGQGSNYSYKQQLNGISYVYTTESKPYSLTAFEIPVGLGFNFMVDSRITVGLELGVHFTTTDYIDDCSGYYFNWSDAGLEPPSDMTNKLANKRENKALKTGEKRGNSGYNDAYVTALIIARYKLPSFSSGRR